MLRISYFYNWQVLEHNEFIRGFCFAIRGILYLNARRKERIPRMAKQNPRINSDRRLFGNSGSDSATSKLEAWYPLKPGLAPCGEFMNLIGGTNETTKKPRLYLTAGALIVQSAYPSEDSF
jgi:hypothetical protein